MSPRGPGGGRHYCLYLSRWPTFPHFPVLGTLALLGQASKFCSSPLESLMDVIILPTPSPVSTRTPAVVCCWPAAATGCLYAHGLPLRPASTACLYSLPLQPASTACLYAYGLPLCLRSAFILPPSSIIYIVLVHFLFKQNIYLSLLYVIYILSFFISLNYFPSLLPRVQLKNVIFICCWLSSCLVISA